jgi:hypothetical protein
MLSKPLAGKALSCVFAGLAVITSTYHTVALFCKVNESGFWRNLVFVIIGIFCIYGFLKRPKYFIYFYIILLIQQYYSHGRHLINSLTTEHRIHWISLMVLVFMPLGLIYLWLERKRKFTD